MQHLDELIPLFSKLKLNISNLIFEKESLEYEACTYNLNFFKVISRKAKVTPKKIGQFVTVWKRNKENRTTPFNHKDNFDFIIIFCKREENAGVFIFPKQILVQHKIISKDKEDGKRGFRVYPSWDCPTNRTAKNTQKWQINYFLKLATEQ
ncbi:MepB family protein [uncultured Maribacter sp.]|uniref:MepB family protein n=1 Tax=uncultured Maribacter sp. TaxID=431308 RepID=UPI002626D375|nr:MepB family protein [uncultured Maribacter sp.]